MSDKCDSRSSTVTEVFLLAALYLPITDFFSLRFTRLIGTGGLIPIPYYREGDGFLIIYSITQQQTFNRVEKFKHQISRVKDSDNIPVVIVGNKCDKVQEREVSFEEGKALARRMGCEFGKLYKLVYLQARLLERKETTKKYDVPPLRLSTVETSAKSRLNLELAYYTAVRLIRAQRGDAPGNTSSRRRERKRCIIL